MWTDCPPCLSMSDARIIKEDETGISARDLVIAVMSRGSHERVAHVACGAITRAFLARRQTGAGTT